MKLIHITDLTLITEETVATIGFFDGVHIGHRYLISQLKELGEKKGLKTSVVTFLIHPRKVLQKEYQPQLLSTFEERIQKLTDANLDFCYVLDFTLSLSEKAAEDFMCSILADQLKIKDLLIGYDHKFGKDRSNNYNDYVEFGKKCGISVHQVKKYEKEGIHISSTSVRKLLSEGQVKEAAKLLSYNYFIRGKVIDGDKIGRSIGTPTANLKPDSPDKIIPPEGVYAVNVGVDNQLFPGMAYIGNRPTVTSNGEKRLEINIFNFNENIYGAEVIVEFVDYIRGNTRFNNMEELKKQLSEDKKASLLILDQRQL